MSLITLETLLFPRPAQIMPEPRKVHKYDQKYFRIIDLKIICSFPLRT